MARVRRARGKGSPLRIDVDSFQTLVHSESCQHHRPPVPTLVHRCPRSVRQKLAQPVVDHITLLDFVLISAYCVAKLDIVHQNVRTKAKRLHSNLACVHSVPTLWAALYSMACGMGQRWKQPKKIKTRVTSKTLLLSHSRVWKGLPFLMEEPRRPFLDLRVCSLRLTSTRVPRLRRLTLALHSLGPTTKGTDQRNALA